MADRVQDSEEQTGHGAVSVAVGVGGPWRPGFGVPQAFDVDRGRGGKQPQAEEGR